jgi:hypothetical protein
MTDQAFYQLRLKIILNQLSVDERLFVAECMRLFREKAGLSESDDAEARLASFDERHPTTEELFDKPLVPAEDRAVSCPRSA